MRKGPGSVYDKWNISKGYSGQKPLTLVDQELLTLPEFSPGFQ
jgi:hypothetical protein